MGLEIPGRRACRMGKHELRGIVLGVRQHSGADGGKR